MIKEIRDTGILLIITSLLSYLITSFIALDLNILSWTPLIRFAFILIDIAVVNQVIKLGNEQQNKE